MILIVIFLTMFLILTRLVSNYDNGSDNVSDSDYGMLVSLILSHVPIIMTVTLKGFYRVILSTFDIDKE